ncbi:nucleoside deaminase [Ferruginibacter paludis]|uniref:nucleoside deaminase n=1 Tax=Ferruginibacter paludis TaxID=1310417 RepID=UPI0025B5095A|nr:nucleoside deaminase [Ferruginibacter paludis]MDN3656116.1 nucleoside deaminase [Ferruginibacter paludis]
MINKENSGHEFYMAKCIELAKVAKIRGDSPVGSLIVRNEKIIGEGIEGGKFHKDITFHAEIEAIRQAGKNTGISDFSDCILYTTHEPCIMCSYIIRHHKVGKIIVGITTGEFGGYSSKYPLLLDTSIDKWGSAPVIVQGVLGKECRELHK